MHPRYFTGRSSAIDASLRCLPCEIHGEDMQADGWEFGETYVPVESSSPLIAEPNKQMQSG